MSTIKQFNDISMNLYINMTKAVKVEKTNVRTNLFRQICESSLNDYKSVGNETSLKSKYTGEKRQLFYINDKESSEFSVAEFIYTNIGGTLLYDSVILTTKNNKGIHKIVITQKDIEQKKISRLPNGYGNFLN